MRVFIYLFLLLTIIIFSSCSLLINSSSKKKEVEEYIFLHQKTNSYYKDYKRVFILEAIYFDWNLRQKFIAIHHNYYHSDKVQTTKIQRQEYQQKYYFFVLVSFQKLPSQLEKEESVWKFFLKDWHSEEYLPMTKVEKLNKENIYYQFLATNYKNIDNWTELYLLKMDRDFSITPKQNLILQLSSLQAKAQLEWKASNLFFLP